MAATLSLLDLAIQNDDEDLFELVMMNDAFKDIGETTYDPALPPFDFNSYSNVQCVNQFRFEKMDIPLLATALGIPEIFRTTNGCVLNSIDLMCILLRRLSYPTRLTDLERIFVRPKSTLSHTINELIDFLYENHHHRIDSFEHPWMDHAHLQLYADIIHQKGAPLT
jgi:hypothetical protein